MVTQDTASVWLCRTRVLESPKPKRLIAVVGVVFGRFVLVDFVGFALAALAAGGFLQTADGASLAGGGIGAQAVDLPPLVVLWQVLGDGKTFLIAEEQSMAVFPALHLVAGADPGTALDLFGLVFVVVARAEGAAEVVDVLG